MSKTSFVIISISLLFLVGFSALFIMKRESPQVACTMEAKLCPDGSYVGRQGPQCEFAECPSVRESITAKLNQKILNNEVYITPLKIIEDSRCPADVTCIWAGQVRLQAKLQSGNSEQEIILISGKPFIFSGKSVTLTDILPAKDSKKEVPLSEYGFDFLVK